MKDKNIFTFVGIFIIILSNLGVTRGNENNDIKYEIKKYEIDVKIPETYDKIEVRAILDIQNLIPDAENNLKIMLGRYFRGIRFVDIQVFDTDENLLESVMNNDTLSIKLPYQINPGNTDRFSIKYNMIKDEEFSDQYSSFACEISDTLCHINAAITRTDNWYPKIEGTMHKRLAEFQLKIDVPARFEVMASGKLMKVVEDADRKIYHWQNYKGITDRSLYFFAQEQEMIIKGYPGNFKIIMYIPENALPDNIDYIADVIYKSYKFFERIYGEVPGDEYKVMAFIYGYSGLYKSMTAPTSLFTSEIKNNEIYHPIRVVIHEVSHTWWGNLVSSNADENYWLYEGFGKYSEVIGIKEAVGADVETLSFFRLKMCTKPYLDNVQSIIDAGKEEDRQLQAVTAYYMGATYLKMLEFILGKEKFYRAIRDYTSTYCGVCITTDDFLKIMEKHCRTELHELLSDYIALPGYARYLLNKVGTVNTGKYYLHTYEIVNVGDKDIYTQYKISSDMEDYKKNFFLKKNQKLTFKVKSKHAKAVDFLVVDPDDVFPVWEYGLKGAGVIVYENDEGSIIFYNLVENTPLSKAGIKNNMILLKVDGEEVGGKGLHELNEIFVQPEGTNLTLLVKEGESEPYEVTVTF